MNQRHRATCVASFFVLMVLIPLPAEAASIRARQRAGCILYNPKFDKIRCSYMLTAEAGESVKDWHICTEELETALTAMELIAISNNSFKSQDADLFPSNWAFSVTQEQTKMAPDPDRWRVCVNMFSAAGEITPADGEARFDFSVSKKDFKTSRPSKVYVTNDGDESPTNTAAITTIDPQMETFHGPVLISAVRGCELPGGGCTAVPEDAICTVDLGGTLVASCVEGACCLGNGCDRFSELDCADFESTYAGDGTVCTGSFCPTALPALSPGMDRWLVVALFVGAGVSILLVRRVGNRNSS